MKRDEFEKLIGEIGKGDRADEQCSSLRAKK